MKFSCHRLRRGYRLGLIFLCCIERLSMGQPPLIFTAAVITKVLLSWWSKVVNTSAAATLLSRGNQVWSRVVPKQNLCYLNRSPRRLPISSMCKFLQKVQVFLIDYIGGGTREVISDFNGSLGSQHFLYAMNERTSFASWASAFESSRLVIGLKWTSDQIVACVFCCVWMK